MGEALWSQDGPEQHRPARAPTEPRPDLRREADLEAAYRAHAGEIHRFVARQLHDDATAADVVQEVFVRAWRHADRYDPEVASLRVWLFTIARNVAVDQVRKARRRPGDQASAAPAEVIVLAERANRDPSDGFSDELVTSWLLTAGLDQLSDEHRTALVETHLRGRPYADLAATWQVPVGTVRSRVFYGLRRLREIMDEMGVRL